MRTVSALAGTATIPVATSWRSDCVSRRAGLVAAALAACSPLSDLVLAGGARCMRCSACCPGSRSCSCSGRSSGRRRGGSRRGPSPPRSRWRRTTSPCSCVVPETIWLLRGRSRKTVLLATGGVALVGAALLPLALTAALGGVHEVGRRAVLPGARHGDGPGLDDRCGQHRDVSPRAVRAGRTARPRGARAALAPRERERAPRRARRRSPRGPAIGLALLLAARRARLRLPPQPDRGVDPADGRRRGGPRGEGRRAGSGSASRPPTARSGWRSRSRSTSPRSSSARTSATSRRW